MTDADEPQASRRRPRFVYFDLGRVLLAFDHEIACRNLAELTETRLDRIREIVFESGLELDYECGKLSTEEFAEHVREQTKRTKAQAPTSALADAAGNIFSANEPVVRLLERVAHKVPVGVLSNTCEAHWEFALRRFPFLSKHFGQRKQQVLSYRVRCLKPDAGIYDAAQQAAEMPSDSLLFIDDMLENAEGARQQGWDAIHYQSADQLEAELGKRELLA